MWHPWNSFLTSFPLGGTSQKFKPNPNEIFLRSKNILAWVTLPVKMFGLGQKVLSYLAWLKFWPILANQETLAILHENEAKFFFFFEKFFFKWPTEKSLFSKIANSQKNFAKISWIGPWVSRIEWCEGHWYGSTYMTLRLSNIRSKMAKKNLDNWFNSYLLHYIPIWIQLPCRNDQNENEITVGYWKIFG